MAKMQYDSLPNDTVAKSWENLNGCLFDSMFQPTLGRHRSNFVFRGHDWAGYGLEHGISRNGGHYRQHRLEKNLLNNFVKYAEYRVKLDASIWRRLALAQHYGLPTRLLDWTSSPYVALHFATADRSLMDEDACVWMLDIVETNKYLPPPLQEERIKHNVYVFTSGMLDEACASLGAFDDLGDDFVLFFEPPSFDDRIVNQFGLFSIFHESITDLQSWLHSRPGTYRRIIIPAKLKREVRDKLDQANFTERVLFPGLDGLCQWLKRYYGP